MTGRSFDAATYAELAEAAERGELEVDGQILKGPAAVAMARRLLMEATGTGTLDEATEIALGQGSADHSPEAN